VQFLSQPSPITFGGISGAFHELGAVGPNAAAAAAVIVQVKERSGRGGSGRCRSAAAACIIRECISAAAQTRVADKIRKRLANFGDAHFFLSAFTTHNGHAARRQWSCPRMYDIYVKQKGRRLSSYLCALRAPITSYLMCACAFLCARPDMIPRARPGKERRTTLLSPQSAGSLITHVAPSLSEQNRKLYLPREVLDKNIWLRRA
jgi:hypothetical protein